MVIEENIPGNGDSGRQDEFSKRLTSGIVVSSRIRLARNIADYPFVEACSDLQRQEIEALIRAGIDRKVELDDLRVIDNEQLEQLERQFLMQLQSIESRTLTPGSNPPNEIQTTNSGDGSEIADQETVEEFRFADFGEEPNAVTETQRDQVFEDAEETLAMDPESVATNALQPEATKLSASSVMLCEEDHVRINVTRSGLDLEQAYHDANQLDDLIEQEINYAFSATLGYLTACPANVGTGMRVSVVLHLPALVSTDAVDLVLRNLQRANVVGRELFGELAGSDFFRISNQATLGFSEPELIRQVLRAIPVIVKAENDAREYLLTENEVGLEREFEFALQELLRIDLDDDSEQNRYETTRLLSRVRMGMAMGLLTKDDGVRVWQLFELVQLRQRLELAIVHEDFQAAASLRDKIQRLEEARHEH